MPPECLDDDALQSLAEGGATGPARAAAVAHVESCAECRRALAALVSGGAGAGVSLTVPGSLGAGAGGAPFDVAVGSRVDRYVIEAVLGRGAMGEVFLAFDPTLARRVALKVLFPRDHGAEATLLRDEAKAMARLNHPNVVTVYEVGEWAGRLFLAMEYVEGETLRRWGKEDRPWRAVLAAWLEAGEGLAAAHAAGVVHRDFKPDNVLVDAAGRVKVSDFGLSLAARDPAAHAPTDTLELGRTSDGLLIGTPAYMAPEQALGHRAAPASDQFSFCVGLYEALVGARPWSGSTLADLRAAITSTAPKAPPRAMVPAHLWRVLSRGLSVRPADRFPSMPALLAALRRDPARLVRRGAVPALLGVALAAALLWPRAPAVACDHFGRQLGGVWDDAVREKVKIAFLGTKKPWAARAFENVDRELTAHAKAWLAASVVVCEASRRPDDAAWELTASRAICLRRELVDLTALTGVFQEADVALVRSASDLLQNAFELNDCSNPKALRTIAPEATRPQLARAADDLRRRRLRAHALFLQGRSDEAEVVAKAVLDEAVHAGFTNEVGHAHFRLGQVAYFRSDFVVAEREYRAAISAGTASRDDALVFWSARAQSELLVSYLNRPDEGRRQRELARQMLEALGSPPGLEATWLDLRVDELRIARAFSLAVELARTATSLRERAYGADSFQVASGLMELSGVLSAGGAFDEAVRIDQRALAVATAALGPEHLELLEFQSLLGADLVEVGALDAGLPLLEDAVARAERELGREHAQTAEYEWSLGHALARTAPEAALRRFEHVAAVLTGEGRGTDELRALLLLSQGTAKRWGEDAVAAERSCAQAKALCARPGVACEFEQRDLPERCLAFAALAQGKPKVALSLAEASLAVLANDTSPYRAGALYAVAQALHGTKGDAARARALVEEALRLLDRYPLLTREREDLEAWLAKPGTPARAIR